MTDRDLFLAALDVPPDERAKFLAEQCEGDPERFQRVQRLLDAHAAAGSFLDQPADVGPTPTFGPSPIGDAPTLPAPAGEAAGALVAGRYKLLQRIGEGGMGAVWMADQTDPVKRRVAVKLVRADRGQSKAILARFEAERQAIALMDHPHIARLLDAGTTEAGSPYFVMELVKGVPLTEFCDAHKLSVPDRLRLFAQVCAAVQHAHQKGVIHRDLKPSNVLVESHDGKPVPKVIDFGLAKATTGLPLTEQTLFTGFGTVLGTPLYMAPEQAAFNAIDVDTRADVYALGVLLYELLTGTTPLTRESVKKAALDEMLKLIREQEAPTPSSRLSGSDSAPGVAANRQTEPAKLGRFVKGELDWIVLKALAKDRDRRYESAAGFARDVERFLNHEPVQAGPPTAAYRVRKFVRRNRPQVVAAGVVFAALLAGLAGTIAGLLEARRQGGLARVEAEAKERARADEQTQRERAEKAAVAEKAAKEQTQKRLAQIEKGVELFAGMLKGINPREEEQGGEPLYVQLRQRAEKAADALDAESVGDPLALARLQTALGHTLRELGSTANSVEVLEKARAIRERELGADHPETLITLNNLAMAYHDAGRLPEAIDLHKQVRDARVKKPGPDHHDTLTSLNNLALAYWAAGRLPEAIALLEQVRDARVKMPGVEHPVTLTTLDNLAVVYLAAGRLPEAIALFEQVRDARVRKPGPDHTSTLTALGNLAGAYREAGRLPEAITLCEQVRDARVKRLGADHPATLSALSNLGLTYLYDGRLPEAIALFEQVRDVRLKKQGADHLDTMTALNNLALAYRVAGRSPEAIALFERVRDARLKMPGGADHPDTLSTLSGLAGAYVAARRLPEAIALLEKVRNAQVEKLGIDHPRTLLTLNDLAEAYRVAGRLHEAIPLFEQSATGIAERRFQHPGAGAILANTRAAYEQAGQLDKAEGWRRRWLAVVKERSGAESPAYTGELAVLGKTLLDRKKWADAEAVLRECLAIREKTQPDDPRTFITRSTLGGALLGQKKYADAEPLLLKGYEGTKAREKAIPPQGRDRIPEAIDRLIELYTATNKPDEAAKWRAERAKYPFVAPPPRAVTK